MKTHEWVVGIAGTVLVVVLAGWLVESLAAMSSARADARYGEAAAERARQSHERVMLEEMERGR